MTEKELLELAVVLLIENRSRTDEGEFADFLNEHYCLDKFNEMYINLLDKFFYKYAMIKTEKSE